MRNMATNKKNTAIVKSETNTAVPVEFVGLGQAVSDFMATVESEGLNLAARVRIVSEYRASNPNASQSAIVKSLSEALVSAFGDASRKYTGFSRATLERLDTIGAVIAHNGWTIDGPTVSALWTLMEKNRPAVKALQEGRKRQIAALETAYTATEKRDKEKREATASANRARKEREADIASGKVNPDAITPAALVASIRERVGKQTWSPEEIGAFAANLATLAGEYAALASVEAPADAESVES